MICTASVTDSVPRWMEGKGRGWVTAEYSMLPASTGERKAREISRGKQDGRGVEIQRLIGRSLRGVVDFAALGERSVYVDCDVLQADGGRAALRSPAGSSRCSSRWRSWSRRGDRADSPRPVGGGAERRNGRRARHVRSGLRGGLGRGGGCERGDDRRRGLVEVQATAERMPLSRASLDQLLSLAEAGIARLRQAQESAAGTLGD